MSIDFLISVLNDMKTAAKVNRDKASNIVLEHPKLLIHLVDLTFDIDNKLSIKAAWVLEWICTHHGVTHIYPYINVFVKNISTLHFDSAIRPCAKICEHLAAAYTSKKENETQSVLTQEHIDLIIETGFDWLITDQKIAVRAYIMNTLYLFGLQKEWVHAELKHLISTKIIHESKGCKARGKYILKMIERYKI
ncbi:adenylosuccinate lyase [Tenacibaculum sp. Bg11-29]|uniref:adenylosuccinate lyase n=1 Tax=Tenacibaculum sp. Bg11-29 TaxID=2058306 RepID=UPI000C340AB5|nr:adenylosuccinate lyase [Tenacibaculum sp. Bg11-29]PKH51295.1 adenylosuccinate lyase [Tenacibaculum sp. Bg11-29]